MRDSLPDLCEEHYQTEVFGNQKVDLAHYELRNASEPGPGSVLNSVSQNQIKSDEPISRQLKAFGLKDLITGSHEVTPHCSDASRTSSCMLT